MGLVAENHSSNLCCDLVPPFVPFLPTLPTSLTSGDFSFENGVYDTSDWIGKKCNGVPESASIGYLHKLPVYPLKMTNPQLHVMKRFGFPLAPESHKFRQSYSDTARRLRVHAGTVTTWEMGDATQPES